MNTGGSAELPLGVVTGAPSGQSALVDRDDSAAGRPDDLPRVELSVRGRSEKTRGDVALGAAGTEAGVAMGTAGTEPSRFAARSRFALDGTLAYEEPR